MNLICGSDGCMLSLAAYETCGFDLDEEIRCEMCLERKVDSDILLGIGLKKHSKWKFGSLMMFNRGCSRVKTVLDQTAS